LIVFIVSIPLYVYAVADSKAKVIKIGVVGPMKYSFGQHTWWGAEIAAEEINDSGGVLIGKERYKIKLIQRSNDLLNPLEAANAFEKLVTIDKVTFVVGGTRSENALAQQEVMADHKVIYIGTGSASPALNTRLASNFERYKYWFRINVSTAVIGPTLVNQLKIAANAFRNELAIEKPRVALMPEKASYMDPILKYTIAMLPRFGLELAGVWRPSPAAKDLTAELSAVKAAQAHIIFQGLAGPVGNAMSMQWGELKIPAALLGVNSEAQASSHWKATNGMCNYEMFYDSHGEVKITDKTIPFFRKFVKKTGTAPMINAVAYDAIYIIAEAIERARTLDTDALIGSLEKTNYVGTMGRFMFENRGHKSPHDIIYGPEYIINIVSQWREGKKTVVWPDGCALLDNKKWEGVKFDGTVGYKLPPWVVEYWRGKNKQ
jgi:branched-chain amino acid transport system substrate-binding protein